ncbi:sensor histidine kinase [Myxococcus sp. AS-1-15]|uniref:sensor histidine kinase n=1 Tax=Myxococcus sp. AS-1-15 TaxID=2874600 RepID=UPI001CC06E64|nr:ATP-binding protein [Myxococcus sp. AS-1-15]MBZ4395754.1 sensor histidine kinase [Myxococcus sp. AS-1-15]
MSPASSTEHELAALLEKVNKTHGPDFEDEPLTPSRHSPALEGIAGAVALLRGDAALYVNLRWQSLTLARGPWRRLTERGQEEGPALLTLRSVVAAEVRALDSTPEELARISRYTYAGGHQQLEVGVRHVRADLAPRVVLVLARDITEQARQEEALEKERRALAEREHLRMLSEQASGIAHDLSSLLVAMKLRLELLQTRPGKQGEQETPAHVDTLLRIVADATTRLSRLRDFARQKPESPVEPVQLADVVRDAVEIARGELESRAAREGLSLHLDVDVPRMPLVESSAADLRCVFLNLLRNGRDAMPRGGTLRVRGHQTSAGQVVITVEDEGTGIPEQHLLSIFQPFFTTKGQHGTGLGLSMAHEVVARARGTLVASNRPEGGAVFTLTLPSLRRTATGRGGRASEYRSG